MGHLKVYFMTHYLPLVISNTFCCFPGKRYAKSHCCSNISQHKRGLTLRMNILNECLHFGRKKNLPSLSLWYLQSWKIKKQFPFSWCKELLRNEKIPLGFHWFITLKGIANANILNGRTINNTTGHDPSWYMAELPLLLRIPGVSSVTTRLINLGGG